MNTSLVLRSIRSNTASCRTFGFGRSTILVRLGSSRPTFTSSGVCALKPTLTDYRSRFTSTFSKYRTETISIVQFTRSKFLQATHHDHRVPQHSGRRPPPGGRPKVSWIDGIPPPVIFWGILALNVGVFVAWWSAESSYRIMKDSKPYIWMLQNFTTSMENVKSGRIWTLITSCFSQNGTAHILFNGFTYFFIAQPVLAMLGNKQFLLLYLGGGMLASLTSLLWNQNRPGYTSHGASGAIYAIITYFACRLPTTKFMIFAVIPIPAWAFVPGVILWDGYEMLTNRATTTDSAGHLGGIMAGAAFFLSRRAGIRL